MKTAKKTARILMKTVLGFLAFLLIYVLAAFSLSKIPVNTQANQLTQDIPIYIKTNGVHTDVVVPIKSIIKDWSDEIPIANTKAKDTAMNYIAFGWGNKDFYLNTPQWSDLKASTAFNAAVGIGDTAFHATFFKTLKENKSCVKLMISKENYQKLVDYIEADFQLDASQKPMFIDATTYGDNDSFYEAKGSYTLFHTCNSWANGALKAANQKAALWTVTDTGIFCHYQ